MTDASSAGPIHRPLIKIEGTVLAPDVIDKLIDCRLDLAIGRPGQAVLRFLDEQFSVLDGALFQVGKVVTIGFAKGSNDVEPSFDGEIVSLGIETGPNDEPVLTATAYDRAHRLARNSAGKVFANQKYSDIVSAMASEVGMQSACTATTITFPYVLQTTNSAALLNEITARTGMVWWVDGKKLTVKPPAAAASASVVLERGRNLRRIRAVSSAQTISDEVTVRSWDPKSKKAIVGQSASRPASLASTSLVTGTRTGSNSFATSKRTATTRSSLSQNEAEQVAKAMHERAMSDELSLRGEAEGNADIKVGGTVEVKGVGTKLSGRYFVTSVEHVYSGRDYRTRFTSAGTAPSTLVDLLAGGAPVPWHRMGPVVGLVSDLGTGENEGMVKVKLPLLGDNIATNWVRVMSVGAGATRGSLVMPSINDEVMVMFEDGDLRRPVVLGSLWNGIDKPPSPVVENGKVIEWVTKSQLGHTLTFRDGSADDKKNVEIALADKTIKLFLGTDKVELFAKDGKPLQLKSGDATITFTAQGDIEIKGGNIKLTATKDVEITGTNVKITGNSTAVVKGNSSVELSGAMAKINASGVTEVKGSIVKIN